MIVVAALLVVFVLIGIFGPDPEDDEDQARPDTTEATATTEETTTTTEATTTTAAPTTTTTAAPTTTEPPAEPIVYSGIGDGVVQLDEPIDTPYIARLAHDGANNFIVGLLDDNGDRSDTLVNTIGNYVGTRPVNFRQGESFSFIEVQADGGWTLTLEELLTADAAGTNTGDTYSGTGDNVILFPTDGATVMRFSCLGCQSNVIATAYGDNIDGLINEIGSYDGTVIVPGGTFMVDIMTNESRGPDPAWTITIE